MRDKRYEIIIDGNAKNGIKVTNIKTGDPVEAYQLQSNELIPGCPVYENKYKVDSESLWVNINPFNGISFVIAGTICPGLVQGKYAFYALMNDDDSQITVYNFTYKELKTMFAINKEDK